MKKTRILILTLGLSLAMGMVATAHDKDVGSSPKIEKQSIIYDLFADQHVTIIAPANPDVGSIVTAHYEVSTAEVPATIIALSRPERSAPSEHFYIERRQTGEAQNYTRPPNEPILLE